MNKFNNFFARRNDSIPLYLIFIYFKTSIAYNILFFREHTYNIKVVDDGIKGVVKTFEQFYSDNDTAYIFTADHGMTDWGSHGAGSAAETETPFIFWGPGIKTSITPMAIEQADLAPLISTLIGIPIPVNSVVSTILQICSFLDYIIYKKIYY